MTVNRNLPWRAHDVMRHTDFNSTEVAYQQIIGCDGSIIIHDVSDEKTRAFILEAANSHAANEAAKKALGDAREAFLGMIADATVWEEDVDGDIDGVSIDYRIHTPGFSFQQLTEALGIEPKWTEGLKACIDRLVDEPPALPLNAEGGDK